MNRLPPHPDERRTWPRVLALTVALLGAGYAGLSVGKRACAEERRAALRAQADADAIVNQNHHMAELTERAAAMMRARDDAIHALPPCRPRVRVVEVTP